MERKPKIVVTDDELNEIFGGPPIKSTTTGRYKFFSTRAETCRRNILELDKKIAKAAAEIAGHENEPGAKYFVDRLAELRADRSRNEREMMRALSHAGR